MVSHYVRIILELTFLMLLNVMLFVGYTHFIFRQNYQPIDPNSPFALPHLNCKYDVFPNFHGADVRRGFLSHLLKELKGKKIDTFIDNNIERGKSISHRFIHSIRGSRISIVVLSRNYASSTWCLGELALIMHFREELGLIVIVVFYEVDPTDVKKQIGEFGRIFRRTCVGHRKEDIARWRQSLAEVATIAGYHSRNWDNDAAMIEQIVNDVSIKLYHSPPSSESRMDERSYEH